MSGKLFVVSILLTLIFYTAKEATILDNLAHQMTNDIQFLHLNHISQRAGEAASLIHLREGIRSSYIAQGNFGASYELLRAEITGKCSHLKYEDYFEAHVKLMDANHKRFFNREYTRPQFLDQIGDEYYRKQLNAAIIDYIAGNVQGGSGFIIDPNIVLDAELNSSHYQVYLSDHDYHFEVFSITVDGFRILDAFATEYCIQEEGSHELEIVVTTYNRKHGYFRNDYHCVPIVISKP